MTDLVAVVPPLVVTLSALAVLVAEAFRAPGERLPVAGLGLIGLAGAAAASLLLRGRDAAGFGVVRADDFSLFVDLVLVAIGALTILLSGPAIERERLPAGEYYALLLLSIAGMMLMASATDLLVIFLALEILSIGSYVLTGIQRRSAASAEAAFKYFLLGAVSSAIFLYGVAFAFAVARSTRLDALAAELAARSMRPDLFMLVSAGLLLAGFGFKISAVPFHMWTPDAYEGAPPVVAGFMSTAVKAAAFAALVRVFLSAFEPLRAGWEPALWLVAMATMVLGTVAAVVQNNVKRMLAYSSIAHAGYLLIGVVAAGSAGKAAVLFYLLVYALANLGAFGVVALLASPGRSHDTLADFAGLWDRHPALAAAMTIFLLSLGGLPPTAGFVGKWYLFSAGVQEGYYGLVIAGVLTSVVSVFFYLRIVVMMYMTPAPALAAAPAGGTLLAAGDGTERPPLAGVVALAAAVAGLFYLGVLPARALRIATASVATIF
jgi:NADH-quinone oxidoreductase subunit N